MLLANTLLGTALVAGGTNAWNQIRERDVDARMARTRRRPLPSGRLTPQAAIWFASAITVAGVGYLAVTVNAITAVLAAVTFATYVLLYTPLKRTSTLNTLVGAVPGALPIVGGWTAAGGSLGAPSRRCSGSCSCGSCRISSRSPGCTGRTIGPAACAC